MEKDIVKEIGIRGLATRLKRIADAMSHSARLMYKQLEMDMEPNWFLILNLIRDDKSISVMDIAKRMGFTHQSVHMMTAKMVKRGYLKPEKDGQDLRRTIFSLTLKARKVLPETEKIWDYGEEALLEIVENDLAVLLKLEIIEKNLHERSFGERIIDKM
ncbi:MAG: helix-turn-helix domain-containing protein [Bacteroidota bacterium]